jgi:putative NADH-flavin reductase
MPVALRSYTLDRSPRHNEDSSEFEFFVGGVLKRKLRVVRMLGGGGVGSVYLAEDITVIRDGEKPHRYALKIIDTKNKNIGNIGRIYNTNSYC